MPVVLSMSIPVALNPSLFQHLNLPGLAMLLLACCGQCPATQCRLEISCAAGDKLRDAFASEGMI